MYTCAIPARRRPEGEARDAVFIDNKPVLHGHPAFESHEPRRLQ